MIIREGSKGQVKVEWLESQNLAVRKNCRKELQLIYLLIFWLSLGLKRLTVKKEMILNDGILGFIFSYLRNGAVAMTTEMENKCTGTACAGRQRDLGGNKNGVRWMGFSLGRGKYVSVPTISGLEDDQSGSGDGGGGGGGGRWFKSVCVE